MVGNFNEYEIFRNKKNSRVYLSRAIEQELIVPDKVEGIKNINRQFRIVSKVFDSKESHQFIKEGKEIVLRVTFIKNI